MPKISLIAKLFRSLSASDLVGAESIAEEIILNEEEIGHHKAARMLKGILKPNGYNYLQQTEQVTAVSHRGNLLAGALLKVTDSVKLSDVMLRVKRKIEFDTIIKEWRNRHHIEAKGIGTRSKLFFYGPPGCGKSYCAKALGNELNMPIYIIRFDAVIGAYLGQTAVHIHELFRFAEMNQCILLFDEIDALGKQRGNPLDVGELDRIVISLMQELEHTNPSGMIIATSNLPTHLDNALWRRFDLAVEFPRPNRKELNKYATSISKLFNIRMTKQLRESVSKTKSYAEAEKVIETHARRIILKEL